MQFACRITKARIQTRTPTMVTRKLLNITPHEDCLLCLIVEQTKP